MKPQRRHFCIEMALQLHLIIFNRQVCYSAELPYDKLVLYF